VRQLEPVKVSVDGREIQVEPAERRAYDAALASFRASDFAAAQSGFLALLARYPKSGYLPSALFWLGNAQYATRDYKEAITNFRILLQAAPDHLRAPEALLSIANCQIELKDVRGARKSLEDLAKAYPQSEAAQAGKERLARLR
jgi:tol-pal system protein YbgF